MSKKRVEAREWKRKRRQKRMAFYAAVMAFCLAVAGVVAFVVWGNHQEGFVMTVDGQPVATADFRFFNAMGLDENMMADFMVMEQRAERYNIAPTAEEREALLAQAQDWYDMFQNNNVSGPELERMADFLFAMQYETQLMEIYTADVALDEATFAEELADFINNRRAEYVDMQLQFLEFDSQEEADAVRDQLLAAETVEEREEMMLAILNPPVEAFDGDFIPAFDIHGEIHGEVPAEGPSGLVEIDAPPVDLPELSLEDLGIDFGDLDMDGITIDWGDLDMGPPRIPNVDLGALSPESFDLQALSFLNEGDIPEVVRFQFDEDFPAIYILFVVEHAHVPTPEEAEEMYREWRLTALRHETFREILDTWRAEANIRFNPRGIAAGTR